MTCDKSTATRRLTNRWNEQCEQFPIMRNEIPLELYLTRNLARVMLYNLLERYDHGQ